MRLTLLLMTMGRDLCMVKECVVVVISKHNVNTRSKKTKIKTRNFLFFSILGHLKGNKINTRVW